MSDVNIIPIGPKTQDLTGKRFGKFLVIGLNHIKRLPKSHVAMWLCKCDCGNTKILKGQHVRRMKSCGCTRGEGNITHGHSMNGIQSPEYRCWSSMIKRCTNHKTKEYPRYGGRGITVCERWRTFDNFIADMGKKPIGKMAIDRIDNNGNYEPGNCRWATYSEQMRNTRKTHLITFRGQTLCLRDWAKVVGINEMTLLYRLRNWSLDNAMTTPKSF